MNLAPAETSVESPSRAPAPAVIGAHAAAVGLLVVGLAAVLVRPLASLTPPGGALAWFDADHLQLVRAYREPRYVVGLVALLAGVAIPLVIALTPAGRRLSNRLVARIGLARPARAAAAVVLAVVVVIDVALLPLAFWSSYVHEGAYGFRTHGLGGWAYDWLVTRAPAWLAAGALALGGYALMRRFPHAWPPLAGLAAAGLTAVLVFASPLILEPLLFRTAPLPDGPAREAIQRVVERADAEIHTLLVADASRRTTKHNAYVSGLGQTRRVVVWDTLLADQTPDDVAMVVAHELGHHLHADVLRNTLFAGAGAVAVAYALAALLRWRTRRGGQESPADPRAAVVALAAILVLNAASLPVQSWASRRAEAAADYASLNLTADPDTYLQMHTSLARANLSDPQPPMWVYLLWFSHPSSAQRLRMGESWAAAVER
ncbi:MAG TPA: M48 family metalloprotease [Egibacteraceae bacterium]|nr:M48 family metalloprotease [Egibacteraceae bacterium]